jgi:hypothetical protein
MAGKPRDASVTTLMMDERIVYLVQHHVQPKRDHYVPAHCNAMVFPPPLRHLLQQFVHKPNPSSEIISQRVQIMEKEYRLYNSSPSRLEAETLPVQHPDNVRHRTSCLSAQDTH